MDVMRQIIKPSRSSLTRFYRQKVFTNNLEVRVTLSPTKRSNKSFQRSPAKSISQASRKLQVPRTTLHRFLRRRLRLCAYKVQIVKQLEADDKPHRRNFATVMLHRIDMDPGFLPSNLSSQVVSLHNVRIWSSESPQICREMVRDSPVAIVWYGLLKGRIIGALLLRGGYM